MQTFEVEAKFEVESFDRIEAQYMFSAPVLERDTYYQHPSRDFIDSDEWLRVRSRSNCDQLLVCYKGSKEKSESGVKVRREIEFMASQEVVHLLDILGFIPLVKVEKYRRSAVVEHEHWKKTITLDDVVGLGKYVEIEALVGEDQDKAGVVLSIERLAVQNGLSKPEKRGYAKMMLKKG